MHNIQSYIKTYAVIIVLLLAANLFTACNKDLPVATPIVPPTQATSPTIATLLNDANFSILKSAFTRTGLLSSLSDPALRFTVFAPDNAAFTASGLSQAVVNAMPLASLAGLANYLVVPQSLPAASIPTSFPNLQYPTLLNPAPTLSELFRLTTFPSKRGANAWVNNIPITQADISAVNGLIHKTALVVAPPSQFLWDRINTDPNLTYLKAAIIRADSGVTAAASLQGYLNNIGANFTVFAPNDAAFKATLTGLITQALMLQGYPQTVAQSTAATFAATPDVFKNPLLYGYMTAQLVQGIIVYHLLGSRAFSVNLPGTQTNTPTLLNAGIALHPGVGLKATLGAQGVTAASVKGLGNAVAANVLINPLPAPAGTSDQHYLNGVLHIIDQVLLPQ